MYPCETAYAAHVNKPDRGAPAPVQRITLDADVWRVPFTVVVGADSRIRQIAPRDALAPFVKRATIY